MELDDIDELLQRYSAAEHRIGANLHDLEMNSAYQILTTDRLSGITGRRLNPALSASPTLWEMFTELQATLDRARVLRGSGNRVKASIREELAQILKGPSVRLETTTTTFAERDLLSASSSDRRLSIEAMLSKMRLAYEPIRNGVAQVEDILRNLLPRIDAADTNLDRAEDQARELGVSPRDLHTARRRLADLRRRATSDPLSIPSNAGDEIERLVHDSATEIAAASRSRDQLQGDLSETTDLLNEIRDLRLRAERAGEEARAKIVNPMGLVRVPSADAIDGPNGLATRLAPIVGSRAPWQELRQQIDDWTGRAKRLRDQLVRAEGANSRDLRRRSEMRGLLSAYRAKMAGLGYAQDLVLTEMADEAHNELFTAPVDLGRAEMILAELGRRLAGGRR